MKKKVIVFLVSIVTLAAFVLGFVMSRDNFVIDNHNLSFGMTLNEIKIRKGQPLNGSEESSVAPIINLMYNENLYGYDAQSNYYFYKGLLAKRLYRIDICIPKIEYNDATMVFDEIVEDFKSFLQDKNGYTYEDKSNEENSFLRAELSTGNGAVGINCSVEYIDGKINIYIENQK